MFVLSMSRRQQRGGAAGPHIQADGAALRGDLARSYTALLVSLLPVMPGVTAAACLGHCCSVHVHNLYACALNIWNKDSCKGC